MKQTIGEKIKFLRIQKGLSQEALARALYFSNRTISNWEHNIREVSLQNLIKIANYFSVPIEHFTDVSTSVQSPQGAFQEVKVRKMAVDDRYFYGLLALMIVNAIMIWIPFQNRISVLLFFFLFWIGFLFITIILYRNLNRQRTKSFFVPFDTILTYQSNASEKQRQGFYFLMIGQYLISILFTTFFYVGVYGMLNLVEVDLTFNAFIVFSFLLMILFQVYAIVKALVTGIPKPSLAYAKHLNDFGMALHRMIVSIQYGMMILFMNYLQGFGHTLFPSDLLMFTLMNGLCLILVLRSMLLNNVKFYDQYKLISQQVSKNQSEILQ